MSRTEGTPARRRRARRAADLVRAPGVGLPGDQPRVPELDALLQEVGRLRRTLETDLALAAAATEAGEPGLAADIVGADREALHNFEAQALGRLDALAADDDRPAAVRRHRWLPAHSGSFVAAAALVGVLAGVVPQALSRHESPATGPLAANASLERLQELVLTGDANEIRAASVALHQQLASVVAVARTDPQAAQNALLLLSYEQSAIDHSADRSQLTDVLQQAQALASAIRAALPPGVRSTLPTPPRVEAYPRPSQRPASGTDRPRPYPSPTARPSSSPSGSTSGSASQPSPSPSSNPYQLPPPPGTADITGP